MRKVADVTTLISNEANDNVSDIIQRVYDPKGCVTFSPENYTPVHIAAYYGHKAFIEYILEHVAGGDIYVTDITQDRKKMNILHICAERASPSKTEDEGNDDKKKGKKYDR